MSKTLRGLLRASAALCVAVGLSGLGNAPAHADVVAFSSDGVSAPVNITSLNFAAGNAVAVNGDNLMKGSTIQLDFQASLGSVTLSNGSLFTPTGLNASGAGGYQITLVVSMTETVTNIFSGPTTATFALASVQSPNSFVELYYNQGVVANPYSGTGFNVGTNILSGMPIASMPNSGNFTFSESSPGVPVIQQFDQSGTGNFPGINTVVGSGSASVGASITSENPNFFLNSVRGLTFNAIDSTPFQAVDPSKLFAGMPGGVPPAFMPNIGAVNGSAAGGGSDFQFQSQSNTSFFVPEPAGFALMGVGLAAMIGYGWRARNRVGLASSKSEG